MTGASSGEPPSNRGLPRVIVVITPSCPNCRAIRPTLEAIENDYHSRVITDWIDASAHPGDAARLRVRGVPTLVAVHADGTEGGRLIGRVGIGDLTALYESALDPAAPAPTGVTSTDRWIHTAAGLVLLGLGIVVANLPILVVGSLLVATGWYDRLLRRVSPLR